MNWDQVEGKWEQLKGQVREQWGKLTDDDLTTMKGKKQALKGRLQERYGYAAERAEQEIDKFMKSCNCDSADRTSFEDEDEVPKRRTEQRMERR